MENRIGIKPFIALLCSLTLLPLPAFSWSVEAHRAIAIIAANRLKGTKVSDRISAILGNIALAEIATCPDEVRELERHQIKQLSPACAQIFPHPPTGTANWHFVDTPIMGATFNPTPNDVMTACKNDCALVQIDKFVAVLKSSSAADTGDKKISDQQALAFVVHFIGDIHQPLHSADRDGDAGGNAEHVSFFGNDNKGTQVLHAVWDNQIVAKINRDPNSLASQLKPQIATAASEPAAKPIDWSIQAYAFARDVAYNGIPAANGKTDVADLGQAYQDKADPVVRIQIARAGIRLADTLNSALGGR
jgi:hypothetical protein